MLKFPSLHFIVPVFSLLFRLLSFHSTFYKMYLPTLPPLQFFKVPVFKVPVTIFFNFQELILVLRIFLVAPVVSSIMYLPSSLRIRIGFLFSSSITFFFFALCLISVA